ncbi:MAG: amidohydrolase [Sulfobacillus sp.]
MAYQYWTNFSSHVHGVEVMVTDAGSIVEIGPASLLAMKTGRDAVVDCEGAFLTPGFWDSHMHLLEYGRSFRRLTIPPDVLRPEAMDLIRQWTQKRVDEREWVLGGGWNSHNWDQPPTASALSSVSLGHPALLFSHDHHSAWLNREALEMLGLSRDTKPVAGGVIERDHHGEPTGIIREKQVQWALAGMEEPSLEINRKDVKRAMHEASRLGLVGATSMEQPPGLQALQTIDEADFPMRVDVMLPDTALVPLRASGIRGGFGGDRLRIKGIKLFWDGALGSQTAWLKTPYEGQADYRGVPVLSPSTAKALVDDAGRMGMAVAMHAIGDEAVHQALAILSLARYSSPLHRVEHAQLLDSQDLEFLSDHFALSMQPVHMVDDYPIAQEYWGNRWTDAFRFRSIWQHGTVVVFGSDAPIATPDVRWGLWMAVHRAPPDRPQDLWPVNEALSPTQALDAYTRLPALADGRQAGVLAPGFKADFTFWRHDPVAALTQRCWEDLTVVGTAVAGQRVWWQGV